MKWILLISLLAAQCGGTTNSDVRRDTVRITLHDTITKIKHDTLTRHDTTVKIKRDTIRLHDTVTKIKIDTLFTRDTLDSIVYHFIPKDSTVYRFIPLITDKSLQKYLNDGNQTQVKFIITHK